MSVTVLSYVAGRFPADIVNRVNRNAPSSTNTSSDSSAAAAPDRSGRSVLRTAHLAALVAVGAMALTAGCSSKVDKDAANATTTTANTTTSEAPTSSSTSTSSASTSAKVTTTDTAPTTSTTTTAKPAATSVTTAATNPDEPTTVQGKGPLPEGDTTVLIVSHDGANLVVDPVELLTGAAAATAYRTDTGEELDGEFYVRNVKKEKVDVDVSDVASFGAIVAVECCDLSGTDLDGFLAAIDGDTKYYGSPLWSITVAGSTVRGVEQVYTP